MTLRIRQIVFATRELAPTVAQFEDALGLQVAYRDPLVVKFGLHNALLPIGDQFIEVLAPIKDKTAAGRHLERHGESAYMLVFQTDNLDADRARFGRLGVRVIWQADYPDVRATQLHPRDIGAAIVSLDQPSPPESWRWAGPSWKQHVSSTGAKEICEVTIGAVDPTAMAQRWADVLGTAAPLENRIAIQGGVLNFTQATVDKIAGYRLAVHNPQAATKVVTLCGTQFRLS